MRKAAAAAPRAAWFLALIAAYGLVLALNLPGHLSVDSVISLAEGRTGQRITWGPPMYSAILGFFDRFVPGTALYVAASAAVLFLAWATLPALRPRMWWTGPLLLAGAAALPQIAIYQGIVWKDVLFANLAVAGFVAAAVAARWWDRPPVRFGAFALAVVLFAFASLVRQNGFLAVGLAALALGWVAWRWRGWWAGLRWFAATLVLPFLLMTALDAATPVREKPGEVDLDVALRLIQHYDMAAALAEDPDRPMPALDKASPEAIAVFRQEAPGFYSPIRSDTFLRSQALGKVIWTMDGEAVMADWKNLLLSDPLGYAQRRFEIWRWVFATPEIDFCLPVWVGANGPPEQMDVLEMEPRRSGMDGRLFNYATWFFETPAMSHVAWALAALGVALFLLLRRDPADLVVAGLMLAALGFAASFFPVSVACDYRYMYFLDLAAITGLLYVAIDPRLRRSR